MESMMSQQWQVPYIPRTIDEVGQDFDHIGEISNHLKFYMNPFVNVNDDWIEDISAVAKTRGMHVVVNMMVDDRQIHDGNWGDYYNRVVNVCSRLNGKVDVILVGNEISLHSPWNEWTVRAKVEPLMAACDSVFSGGVSYEAFWYEKEAWYGYQDDLYFMQYEGLESFEFNVNEMEQFFGSNAIIGEWGEDSIDGNTERDDWWQRLQMELRWNIISQTSTPIAYIYTYREPSWNGFGIIRPDGLERPVWAYLESLGDGGSCIPSTEVCDGADNDCDGQVDEGGVCGGDDPPPGDVPDIDDLPLTCEHSSGCTLTSDTSAGACRTVQWSTAGGSLRVQGCEKDGDHVELYRQAAPSGDFTACFANGCVTEDNGFARFIPELPDEPPTCAPSTEVCDGSDNDCDGAVDEGGVCDGDDPPPPDDDPYTGVESLALSCILEEQACGLIQDTSAGVCRTVRWSTSHGEIRIFACEKDVTFVEIYLQDSPHGHDFEACLGAGCVHDGDGFIRFEPGTTDGGDDPPPPPPSDCDHVSCLEVYSSPSGTKLSDSTAGGCRIVSYSTSQGFIESKICDKGATYEMYLRSAANGAQTCVGSACVGWNAGFASFS